MFMSCNTLEYKKHSILMPNVLFSVRYHLFVLLLLILPVYPFCSSNAALPDPSARITVPVVVSTGNNQGYVIHVLSIRNDGRLFVDLESMARSLRLSSRRENGSFVIEEGMGNPGSLCTVLAGNNFARIVSRDTQLPRRVIQLRSPMVERQSGIYLPVADACRLFELWLDREITYTKTPEKINARFDTRRFSGKAEAPGIVGSEEQVPLTAEGNNPTAVSGETFIKGIEVETRANGAIIMLQVSGALTEASLLKPDEQGYAYLSLEKASCDVQALSKIYSGGVVRSITPKKFEDAGMQFTIALDNRSFIIKSVELQRDEKNSRYMIYIRNDVNVEEIHRSEKARQIEKVISRDIEKWKINTIVLDAGHGGKDPGAIGVTGTREKDVVINIVHDLGNFIRQAWPDVRVVYTRNDDTFIPLHERGRIANRSSGKLFVSVHCNSSPNASAHGSEVYILGPHKTQASLAVAMMENAVIRQESDYQEQYKGFSEEYLIMSSMAQSAFIKQSTILSQDILKPDEPHSFNNARGVRQAGFMVLWTPSMPSALVEVGYLSNPNEEEHLRNREDQTKIAYAIFKGIQAYRGNYESSTMSAMEQR
jgi:N-acetylmuramoyl-L-alanine amidase